MAKVVGDIVIDVFADVGPMVREFNRGEAAIGGFGAAAQRIGARMQSLGASATALGQRMSIATAAIGAAAAALGVLVSQGAAAGDKIANSARAVGLSTTAYQEYAFAIGEVADVTQDEFDRALQVMNRRLGEAKEGSTSAVAALNRIGISTADIESGVVTTEQALAALVGTLEDTTDPAIAAAIASDLLGKVGAQMGGRMAGASGQVDDLRARANELGIVMDGKAIKAAENYNEAVGELSAAWEATKVAIAAEVLPFFVNTLIPFLRDDLLPAVRGVIGVIGEWIDWFEKLPEPVRAAAAAIAVAFAVSGPALMAIGAVSRAVGLLVAGPAAPFVLLAAAAATIYTAWQTWGDDFKAAIAPAIDYISGKFESFLNLLDRIMTRLSEYGQAVAEALDIQGRQPATPGWMNDRFGDGHITGPGAGGGARDSGAGNDVLDGGGAGADRLGAAMVDGMLMGINGSIEANRDGFAQAFGQIPQIARDTLGIESPSTVFAELGGFVGEGFANGIQESAELVGNAVRVMGANAAGAAEGMSNDILDAMGILFQGSKQVGAGIALINTMIGASEELKKGTFGIVSAARVIATGMGFINAIKGASRSGGGAAGAGGAATGGQAAAPPMQYLTVEWRGQGAESAQAIFDKINEAGRNGYRINANVIAA